MEEKGNSPKRSRKSIIFSPFSYHRSCLPENISRHANPVLPRFFFIKKERGGNVQSGVATRWNSSDTRDDYLRMVILRDPLYPRTSPQPAGSNYRAVSWHRFNFPAKYTGDVYLANCLFQTCIAFTVKRYKNTVEFQLNTVGNSKS